MRTNGVIDSSRAGRSVRTVNKTITVQGSESLRELSPGIGMERTCGAGRGAGRAAACSGRNAARVNATARARKILRLIWVTLIIVPDAYSRFGCAHGDSFSPSPFPCNFLSNEMFCVV